MLKIFLDNEWCDYNYNELYYKKGYTNTPSTPLLIYDSSFNEVEGWSNSGYDWIEQDHQWYIIGTAPYFVYQNISISLYRIDTRYSFPVYKKEGQLFLLQDSSFITPSSLHNSQGYTYTPSEPYAEKDGVVWAWYNPSENLYWDDNRKVWTTTPPVYGEPICGSLGYDYSESVLGTPIVRMERGGIGFTGLLRENVIPASGVVEEYVERFDVVTGGIYDMVLPSDHSGSYIKTSMDSLRYYAKGTLSNTGVITATYFGHYAEWYYGTIAWTDETLGDLTDKITVTPLTASDPEKQTIFRIIFISDGEISGYHPSDTVESNWGQITNYNYSNGTHSIEFYSDYVWLRTYAGRLQFRYLDGVTKFENLSTFDLVDISSGTLSKATSTDRFNMYNVWNGDVTIKAYY